jgi:hypothetical protein
VAAEALQWPTPKAALEAGVYTAERMRTLAHALETLLRFQSPSVPTSSYTQTDTVSHREIERPTNKEI